MILTGNILLWKKEDFDTVMQNTDSPQDFVINYWIINEHECSGGVFLCVEGVKCHWSHSHPLFEMSQGTVQYVKNHHTVLFYLKHTATLWNLMTYKIKYDKQDLMRASLKKTQRWGLNFLRGGPGPRARTRELGDAAGELEELGWRGGGW